MENLRKNILPIASVCAFFWLWFVWTGSYRIFTDFCIDLACLLLAVLLVYILSKKRHPHRFWRSKGVVWTSILTFWVLASLVDALRPHSLPVQYDSSQSQTLYDLNKTFGDPPTKFGLALSGGGYRAAVYHAGVLAGLKNIGVEISSLSTVSGGSIIGSFIWRGGDPGVFKQAVVDGKFNYKRELLLIHNVLRLPFPLSIPGTDIKLFPRYSFSRLNVQENLIKRVSLGEVDFHEQHNLKTNLLINMSDLSFGMHIGISNNALMVGMRDEPIPNFYTDSNWELSEPLTLSKSVAISGAFPGVFPETAMAIKFEPITASGRGWRPVNLVDGGVIDNRGVRGLVAANNYSQTGLSGYDLGESWRSDIILLSDTSSLFGVQDGAGGLAAIARAFDVSHVRTNEGDFLPKELRRQLISISPASHILPVDIVANIANNRDIKDFTPSVYVRPFLIPEPLLKKIVRLLPQEYTSVGEKALNSFLEHNPSELFQDASKSEVRIISKYGRQRSRDECLKLTAQDGHTSELRDAVCDSIELRHIIKKGLSEYLLVFGRMPTIKAVIAEEEATALFSLGEALTYLSVHRIERTLKH